MEIHGQLISGSDKVTAEYRLTSYLVLRLLVEANTSKSKHVLHSSFRQLLFGLLNSANRKINSPLNHGYPININQECKISILIKDNQDYTLTEIVSKFNSEIVKELSQNFTDKFWLLGGAQRLIAKTVL